MSFTNINDPTAVAALLEQLKSSTAWQELTAASASNPNAEPSTPASSAESSLHQAPSSAGVDGHTAPSETASKVSPITGSTVASLLSQLKPFSTGPNPYATSSDISYSYEEIQGPSTTPLPTVPSTAPSLVAGYVKLPEDRSKFSFRQSLPVVSELADSPFFVAKVKKMRSDQEDLERRLWLDREAIYTKYNEKLKITQTKAQMIGAVVSQHELNMITDAFKKEIFKFDLERVIPAWDGLVSRQQLELAQLDVPTMFVTGDGGDLERQQQVIRLLETILGPKAP